MARGDILRVRLPDLPSGSGHEQIGERPVVVVQTDDGASSIPMLLIVPFTSKPRAERFPFTIRVLPTPENGLTSASILLVFQLRALDKSRILSKLGALEPNHLRQVDEMLKQILQLH